MRNVLSVLCVLLLALSCSAADLIRGAGGTPTPEDFAAAWGVRPEHVRAKFASDGEIRVQQIAGTAPANIVHEGEQTTLTVQVENRGKEAVKLKGRWVLVESALETRAKGVFDLGLVKLAESDVGPVELDLPTGGFSDVEVPLPLPERYAAFALLLERENGVRLFAGSVARTVKAATGPGERFYQICMDLDEPEAIERLHTAPNRIGIPYVPTTSPDFEKKMADFSAQLRAIHATGYPVCVEFGAGVDHGDYLPLGRTRPHLDKNNVMLETKSDYTWKPEYDADFKQYVKRFALEFGWPKGPVNAMKYMNEPWNGISISGWGADDLRYREIYTVLCEAVEEAREEAGVQILLGGCDSSSNTFDKLFPDGDMSFLKRLDFMSLHYQGLSPSNARYMRDRQHPEGRVRFWDTESWVANSQDRVPGVLAGMLAAGHDRIVGIQSHAVVATRSRIDVRLADGKKERRELFHAWPVAPAQVAFQHFVGNRPFKELVLGEALPWVFRFQGEQAEDLALVVCGDLSPAFDNTGSTGIVPLRSVRGLAELDHEAELRAQLAELPAESPKREALQKQIDLPEPLSGASMTLAADERWSVHDGSGNAVAAMDGSVVLPLDGSGWYLKPDGTAGSAEALLAAVRSARIDGYEPLATRVHDAVTPVGAGAAFRVEMINVLNRPVTGRLQVSVAGLEVQAPAQLSFQPHEKKDVLVQVIGGRPTESNLYDFALRFDAGTDGRAEHAEQVRVNLIHRRTIAVDGNLDDWAGALPQSVMAAGGEPTLMESAWLPMVTFDDTLAKGFATGWLAADEQGLYFAAKIADSTPDAGMFRYATLDDSYCFYPEVSYRIDPAVTRTASVRDFRGNRKIALCDQVWQPAGTHMSLTLDLPGKRLVSLYFADDDHLGRRFADVVATDAAGKTVLKTKVDSQDGVWLRLRLSGKVDITVGNTSWLKATLAAVAVDPLPADADEGPVLGVDVAHKGSREGYGSELLLLPDQEPQGAVPVALSDRIEKTELRWPEGVRRFSYARRPKLPQGPGFDNVQLAFNVLPDDQKPWHPTAPGTFKGYAGYWDTDYEFALNPVAEEHGGGVEVWPLRLPGKPNKHFYPRSPKYPGEGPVSEAKLVVRREGNTRLVEAMLPWSVIPEVKAAREAGRPVKFSYRVNDNAGGSCMELSRGRSVAKRNGSFKPDWGEHWANELEFGWE